MFYQCVVEEKDYLLWQELGELRLELFVDLLEDLGGGLRRGWHGRAEHRAEVVVVLLGWGLSGQWG